MRITMKAQISGTRNGEEWPAIGEVIDLPAAEATDMVAAGLAEAAGFGTPPATETATAPGPGQTASPRRTRKAR